MEKDNFVFDEKKHLYKLNDKPLTGVTTILNVIAKPALIPWAVKTMEDWIKTNCKKLPGKYGWEVTEEELKEAKSAHRKKMEKAGDIGTEAHKWIENWIKKIDQPEPENEMVKKMVNHFMTWARDNKVEFLESEKRVYSKKHWFAGTCDLVLKKDGKIYIGDLKTSSGIYPEYFWQTAGYQLAIQEMGNYPKIEGHIIINCTKTGNIEVKEYYGYEKNKEAFLACLTIYRVLEELKTITK